MSIFPKIFGPKKTPDAIETASDVSAALAKISVERQANSDRHRELTELRRSLLASDAADSKIIALDRELEALAIAEEKLDLLEPQLHARLRDFADAARRERLAELEAEYRDVVVVLDGAMSVTVEAFQDYQRIVKELDAGGFNTEARGFIVAPGMIGDGVLCGATPLENWRRERDRLAAMRGRASAGLPLANPLPAVSPEEAARRIAARKPAPRPAAAQEYRPQPARQPRKTSEEPSYGFARIFVLRAGLEINGEQRVTGDELILPSDQAETLARNGAIEIISIGEVARAAE